MSVVIAPNIKKESIRINLNGEQIDPRTKKVIKKEPPEYIPPPPHVLEAWRKEADEKRAKENPKPEGTLAEVLEAVAQKRAKDMLNQVDNRTVEILKELLK